ncbi:MAG: FecR domain-containing protein [Stellaceae bacterium]
MAIAASCLALSAHADDAPPAGQPAAAASTAADIGRSVVVVSDVDGQSGNAPAKRIAVNDNIVFQEDITTGNGAKAVIEFRDGSTFELGPDAAARIDSFIFNPEESTSHKALQVTRGVFRYVSGYVSSDQNTQISTPAGSMAIRGSVAEGIVDPDVPDFVYLGEGSATFTNSAGNTPLQPGNSIAVPSDAIPPMAASAMPDPVAAEALEAIENSLPPRADLANRSPADDAWLTQAGTADLVPVAEQQSQQAAAVSRPLPTVTGSVGLAAGLSLLIEANRLKLFNGRQTTRTPEQAAFLARATREHPNAAIVLRRFDAQSRTLHAATMDRGTTFVLHGVGRAAPSAEVMRRVTAASMHANPRVAASIQRRANEAYRRNDRGELNRSSRPEERAGGQRQGGERQGGQRQGGQRQGGQRQGGQRQVGERLGGQRPAEHQPNAFERRQQGGNERAQPPRGPVQQRQFERTAPQRQVAPRQPPPKAPAGKPPPKRKDERDQR